VAARCAADLHSPIFVGEALAYKAKAGSLALPKVNAGHPQTVFSTPRRRSGEFWPCSWSRMSAWPLCCSPLLPPSWRLWFVAEGRVTDASPWPASGHGAHLRHAQGKLEMLVPLDISYISNDGSRATPASDGSSWLLTPCM